MMSGRYWGRSVSEVIKGPVPADHSWKYDEAAKALILKAQTYATDGKASGIGEYVLNPEDMTLKVVKDGR